MVGNLANFTKIDILRCLLKIDGPVSRSQLSKSLELGEGTIRAILDILKKNGLLESNRQGHYLSKKGKVIAEKVKGYINIKKIDLTAIFPDKRKIALHVREPNQISKSYILRDEAIKNGADGSLILNYDGGLNLSDSDYKQDFSGIGNQFDLGKNDIVIVAYANSYKLAEHGALAAAIQINSGLKNIMQKFR